MYIVLLTTATFCIVLPGICVFCLLVVLVRLSVPLQVIEWKLVSEMTYNVLMGMLNPTHSLIQKKMKHQAASNLLQMPVFRFSSTHGSVA